MIFVARTAVVLVVMLLLLLLKMKLLPGVYNVLKYKSNLYYSVISAKHLEIDNILPGFCDNYLKLRRSCSLISLIHNNTIISLCVWGGGGYSLTMSRHNVR